MKRSEAIEQLNAFIDENGAEGSEIIAFLEKLGMLPPFLYCDIDENVYEWEPETVASDETSKECIIPEYAFKCNNCTCEVGDEAL